MDLWNSFKPTEWYSATALKIKSKLTGGLQESFHNNFSEAEISSGSSASCRHSSISHEFWPKIASVWDAIHVSLIFPSSLLWVVPQWARFPFVPQVRTGPPRVFSKQSWDTTFISIQYLVQRWSSCLGSWFPLCLGNFYDVKKAVPFIN